MVSSFTRQQFHCGEKLAREALVQLNWHAAHQLLLANDRLRLNIFALITLSITVFTCNYYFLIKVLVHGKSK